LGTFPTENLLEKTFLEGSINCVMGLSLSLKVSLLHEALSSKPIMAKNFKKRKRKKNAFLPCSTLCSIPFLGAGCMLREATLLVN
jgi:hypothetical protein